MIDRDEYAVRLLDLPEAVGGFITESPDGFTNIYINARHSHDGQLRACGHELDHAGRDDLHSTEPVAVIEARASGEDPRLKSVPKLIKARDLLPPPPPQQPKPTAQPLTPHQARVLLGCLSELDRFVFSPDYDY